MFGRLDRTRHMDCIHTPISPVALEGGSGMSLNGHPFGT